MLFQVDDWHFVFQLPAGSPALNIDATAPLLVEFNTGTDAVSTTLSIHTAIQVAASDTFE